MLTIESGAAAPVVDGQPPGDPTRPGVTPIHQTATFEQDVTLEDGALEFGTYDYTRSGNPTRRVLEERLAVLEGGAFLEHPPARALPAVGRSAAF